MPTLNNAEYQLIEEVTSQRLNNLNQSDASYTIYGYKHDKRCATLYHIFSILLLGVPYLIFHWYPKYKVIKFKKCPLSEATIILFCDKLCYSLIMVKNEIVEYPGLGVNEMKYFCHQHTKYVWMERSECYGTLDEFLPGCTLAEIVNSSCGLLETEERKILKIYGPNKIEVEIKSYWKLFVEEVFNPYYIFQGFSVILWSTDNYYIYAACIVVLTLFSAVTSLMETRKQSIAIHDIVETSRSGNVEILRRHLISNNESFNIDPSDLVPGDLMIIPRNGCVMPCDAVLVKGNCIVNESMLTGESVPVLKTSPHESDEMYNSSTHKRHTLFCGTHVVQPRYYGNEHVLARVMRTGYDTTKGYLVKSILYPAPVGLKFYKDSMKFVLFLFVIAASGMIYSMYLYAHRNVEVKEMIVRILDIITIVVPPALPAAMTVATVYSQNRLKKLGIFCISPPRINVCGKIKLACFDKTGTLTHEGLDLYCTVPVDDTSFLEPIADVGLLDLKSPLLQAMATCHSITRIEGNLSGDPLELSMFDSTHWELEEAGLEEDKRFDLLGPTIVKPRTIYGAPNIAGGDSGIPYEIGIVKTFEFSSSLQCMSVIIRELGSANMTVYTKGAPEKISALCNNESLPPDYAARLSHFTVSGYRVIATAYKHLPENFKWKDAQKARRDLVECDLNFIGFIVMRNMLKPETAPVISLLDTANIRTVMITGDNIDTAISVARECHMVKQHDKIVLIRTEEVANDIPRIICENVGSNDVQANVIDVDNDHYHFAMDGKTWTKLCSFYPDLLPMFLVKTTVFARFQPDQKTHVVRHLQELAYIVSMVGDGANDCGALKAAHVGVSLSQSEASVAAPFTSTIENISCIIHLMLEGRCALVTSFAEIKYMAMYSLIQFFTVLILYKHHSILGDTQFLFIDLIITTSFALAIGRQGPSDRLVPKRPMGSLVSPMNLVPIILQALLCGAIQLCTIYYLSTQPWFEPVPSDKDGVILSWENTVLFTVSCYQYIILAIMYSKGKPYRQQIITNFWLLFSAVVLVCFVTYLCTIPAKPLADFFEMMYVPYRQDYAKHIFRVTLLLFPLVHLFVAVLIEVCIADSKWLKTFIHFLTCKKVPKNKYKELLKENNVDNWINVATGQSIITPPSSINY